tara:strand:- start:6551 stop:7639 length:1089 start_codon:yes stop_codon:yes gene_type:complete
MAVNNRVYYACQSVQIAGPSGSTGATNTVYDTVQGLQSVGIETNFNLEPIYQMGQLDLYENFEDIPDVSVSLNKALDGMPTIYSMAMGTGTLAAVAENRCSVRLTIHPDTDVSATGTPIAVCQIEPAYLSSVTYNFPSDGNFTEDVTIVGNNKSWLSSASATSRGAGMRPAADNPNSGAGIVRRQMFDQDNSLLPTVVATTDPKRTQASGGIPNVSKIQSINISMDLGREEIYSLGQRLPYTRFVDFPVEVTCAIETIAATGDMVGAAETETACSNPKALLDKQIFIKLCDGSSYDLGPKNKLQSVSYEGGDTGGGNATATYNYLTYSHFTHIPPNDAAAGSNVNTAGYEYSDVVSDLDYRA